MLGTLLPDPLYKVKGRINSPADPLGGTGGGVERQGHRELGKENITSVLGGLLDFLDWETAFFFLLIILKFFLLVYLGFLLTPTKSLMDAAIVLKVVQSGVKPEVF